MFSIFFFFFFQAEDGIRDFHVTGVQTCALPILPDGLRWIEVPVMREETTLMVVPAGLIGLPENGGAGSAAAEPPFTLAGDIFESSGHADLIRLFLPFGLDAGARATGVLEVGYHRSLMRRPDWGQVEALRAAAG